MSLISSWISRHWGRGGAACTPPSPIGPGSQHRHGHRAAGNTLAVGSHNCWPRAPCVSPAWCHKAPWSWWSSYSKWIWGSGVHCLYFPLSDPQVHGDLSSQISRFFQTRLRLCDSWGSRARLEEKLKNTKCELPKRVFVISRTTDNTDIYCEYILKDITCILYGVIKTRKPPRLL